MTIISPIIPASQQNPATPLVPNPSPSSSAGVSFSDILDTINPLQHIPGVSSVYRAVTGGTISTGAKVTGDTLYGFLLGGGIASAAAGAASSVADAAVKSVSGTDVGEHIANTISSITSSENSHTSTLIPDPNAIPGTVADTQPQTPSVPNLFPFDKNPAVTAGKYHHAQLHDDLNKKLLQTI